MPIETPAFDSGVAIMMNPVATSAIIMNFFFLHLPLHDLTKIGDKVCGFILR